MIFCIYGSFAYKKNLSLSGYWLIMNELTKEFTFSTQKLLIIDNPYGVWGISGQVGLCSFMFFV